MKTGKLVEKIRLGMSLPKNENRFSDAALLDLANDELQASVLPWLFSLREEYAIDFEDLSLKDIATEDKGYINYPAFSAGRTLKDLWVSLNGKDFRPLERVGLEKAWIYSQEVLSTLPSSFALQGDRVYLYPKPKASDLPQSATLRFFFHTLPNTLVQESRGTQITAITGDATVQTGTLPSFMKSSGVLLDVILSTPDHQVAFRQQKVDSFTTNTLTFDGFGPTNTLADAGFKVGQLICLEGETVRTPLPTEINQLLVQAVVVRVLESLNSPQQLSLALERFNRLKRQLRDILSPRTENRPLKFVPSYSFIRAKSYGRRF